MEYEDKFGQLPDKPEGYENFSFSIVIKDAHVTTIGAQDDVVYKVNFDLRGQDANGIAVQSHTLEIATEELLEQSSFKDFSDLMEADILAWINEKKAIEHLRYSLVRQVGEANKQTGSVKSFAFN